jgi:hypothetical protein
VQCSGSLLAQAVSKHPWTQWSLQIVHRNAHQRCLVRDSGRETQNEVPIRVVWKWCRGFLHRLGRFLPHALQHHGGLPQGPAGRRKSTLSCHSGKIFEMATTQCKSGHSAPTNDPRVAPRVCLLSLAWESASLARRTPWADGPPKPKVVWANADIKAMDPLNDSATLPISEQIVGIRGALASGARRH